MRRLAMLAFAGLRTCFGVAFGLLATARQRFLAARWALKGWRDAASACSPLALQLVPIRAGTSRDHRSSVDCSRTEWERPR